MTEAALSILWLAAFLATLAGPVWLLCLLAAPVMVPVWIAQALRDAVRPRLGRWGEDGKWHMEGTE